MSIYPATDAYIHTILTGVPYDPTYEVWDGTWKGWCCDKYHNIYYPNIWYDPLLFSSMAPELQPDDVRFDVPWDKINYIINHKQGTMDDVQAAIWWYTDGLATTDPEALAMIADADANGVGWWPGEGHNLALICYVNSTVQLTFIEIDP